MLPVSVDRVNEAAQPAVRVSGGCAGRTGQQGDIRGGRDAGGGGSQQTV